MNLLPAIYEENIQVLFVQKEQAVLFLMHHELPIAYIRQILMTQVKSWWSISRNSDFEAARLLLGAWL